MERLHYNKLEMQPYLKSKNIFPDEAKKIYKFRTFMGEAKRNFRTKYLNNLQCEHEQCDEEETQEHLLKHIELPVECESTSVMFDKLFSCDPKDNQKVASLLQKAIDKRDKESV